MKSYQEFKLQLDEKALHMMFKKFDTNMAKKIHKELKSTRVIHSDHSYGQKIEIDKIDKYHAHNPGGRNFRNDITAYNEIIHRQNKKE